MRVENLDEVLKSFDTVIETLERKLKAVVRGYAIESAKILVGNTPYGDVGAMSGSESWYSRRSNESPFGSRVDEVPGTARNNWRVATLPVNFSGFITNDTLRSNTSTGVPFDFPSGSPMGDVSISNVARGIDSYKIGDMIVLWNNAPYISRTTLDWSGKQGLEQGSSQQAPNGIRQPSISEVMAMYKAGGNIKANFDGG